MWNRLYVNSNVFLNFVTVQIVMLESKLIDITEKKKTSVVEAKMVRNKLHEV